jgi:3-hydroxybutyryl-CoA dehydrogenase
MDINQIAVVGAGTMGAGIAEVMARSGLDVTLVDVDDASLERAAAGIRRNLDRLVARERLGAEESEQAIARIAATTDLEAAAAAADHVVETVFENFEAKVAVLSTLDRTCRPEVVIGTNTSQFSISRLASGMDHPERLIGTHWFNPPPLMGLIEVIRGVETSDAALATAYELAAKVDKEVILCRKDTPGFITSRLIVGLGLEAARIVEEGVADAEDVNRACVLAFNHAMGPLDTFDFSGLDTALSVADNMRDQYGERFLAPQNLRSLVAANHLGRKTGRGFRDYGGTR